MSEIRQAVPDAKKPSVLLPVMGLVIAVCCGVIAYFSAPMIIDALIDNFDNFQVDELDDTQIIITSSDSGNVRHLQRTQAELATAATVGIILFSILMTFVSMVGGRAGLKERQETLAPPKPGQGSDKDWEKYERKLAKQRREKIEALKRIKAKKEAEERRKKK